MVVHYSASNILIDHSYLKVAANNGYVTAAVQILASWGPANNVTVQSSYLEGANGADIATTCGATNLVIKNNALSRNNGWGGTTTIYGFNKNGTGNINGI